jgi:hypothetical protein
VNCAAELQRAVTVPSAGILFSQRVVGGPARALRHWRVAFETDVVIDLERLRTYTVYFERRWHGRGCGRAAARSLSVPRAVACDMRCSRCTAPVRQSGPSGLGLSRVLQGVLTHTALHALASRSPCSAVASVLRSLHLHARRVPSRTLLGADLLLTEVTLWACACPTRCSHCRRALFSALDTAHSPRSPRRLSSY